MRTALKINAINLGLCLALPLAPFLGTSESRAQQAVPNTPPAQTGPGSTAPSPSQLAAARTLVIASGLSRSFTIIIPQFMDQIAQSLTADAAGNRKRSQRGADAAQAGIRPAGETK